MSRRTDKNTEYDVHGVPYRRSQKALTYSDEDITREFEQDGCVIHEMFREVVTTGTRQRVYRVIKYTASCGHEATIRLGKWKQGQGRLCAKCTRPRGAAHYAWNPELSDEERIQNRDTMDNTRWRTAVYERDRYRCQVCGDSAGGDLAAHHLSSYMDYPEQRYKIENGITLCETCHKAFHRAFSYHHNTAEQFDEWRMQANTEVSA